MSEQITKSIIVKANVSQAFHAWANFENFPHFMSNVKQVAVNPGGKTSHWEVEGPLGKTVEWDAEVTRFEEPKRIAWSTKDRDGDVTTSGQVTFNDLPNNETEVTVLMQYDVQGMINKLGEKFFANPEKQVQEDLSNYKSFVEGMYNRAKTG